MTSHKPVHVLLIDNFDSFSFNLAEEFEARGCKVEVWRNDISADKAMQIALSFPTPRLIVLSPGPGTPAEAGCNIELIQKNLGRVPLLGVCLGHQAMVEALGGTVGPAPEIVHGKSCVIELDGEGIFAGFGTRMAVGRYHSLAATKLPDTLHVQAHYNNIVMAVRHVTQPMIGLQFHPESILTTEGGTLIANILRWVQAEGAS